MSKSTLITNLENEVEANLNNEQFGVEELADKVNMSRSHLHRKLKKETGQSISQFIREYRLRKAHDLLVHENLTSAEVAYKVGFGSATYFSKAYNDLYGFSPGETKSYTSSKTLTKTKHTYPSAKILITGIILILLISSFFLFRSSFDHTYVPKKTLAVLPFKNLSADQNEQYFADGVMVAILQKLSTIHELKVISRTSAERYRETEKTLPQIAEELGVEFILEGSAQKYGDDIRVIAQLINTNQDAQMWSTEYNKKFENILHLQNEIAQEIVHELQTALTPQEKEILTKIPTNNTEAYNYYLQADFLYNKFNKDDFEKAIPLYQKAIELDPFYIDPYIGLASVWQTGGLVWGIFDENKAHKTSKDLLLKVLEIDHNNTPAHNVLGSIYLYYEWDFEKARYHFEKTRQISGIYGDLTLDYFIKMGQPEKTYRISLDYIELDPLFSSIYIFKSESLFFMGDTAQAITVFDEAINIYQDLFIMREAAKLYYLYGQREKAKNALEKYNYLYSDRPPIIYWLEAAHAYHEGRDTQIYVDQLLKMYNDKASGSPAWCLALYYAVVGDEKQTLDWLEKSYDRHEVEMTWLKMEPVLAPYKENLRYKVLLKKMAFPGN